MENKLAISIIVPVYNNEEYLEKCLNSILNQTFQQYEIIIINDGSTDKSGAICRAYAEKESRITVIDQDKRGVSAARNLGVQRAVGTFIGFVDGDDYIDENMYEYLYEACIRTGSDISICKLGRKINGKITNEIDDDYELILEHETAMEELFKGELYRFSLCNKLFNKSCFDHVTFPVG